MESNPSVDTGDETAGWRAVAALLCLLPCRSSGKRKTHPAPVSAVSQGLIIQRLVKALGIEKGQVVGDSAPGPEQANICLSFADRNVSKLPQSQSNYAQDDCATHKH